MLLVCSKLFVTLLQVGETETLGKVIGFPWSAKKMKSKSSCFCIVSLLFIGVDCFFLLILMLAYEVVRAGRLLSPFFRWGNGGFSSDLESRSNLLKVTKLVSKWQNWDSNPNLLSIQFSKHVSTCLLSSSCSQLPQFSAHRAPGLDRKCVGSNDAL